MLLVIEKAYAKINLALDVFAKRADGFHEVKMVMQSVDLFDNIFITEADGLHVQTVGAMLPDDESNIAYRAVQFICRYAKVKPSFNIKIEKNIPLGAGLAGGSADAAAVLRGVNRLYNLGFSTAKLEELAAQLGSDVPFCINGGTSLATGRGEIITPLTVAPAFDIVLANPGFEVSTGWVYKNFARSLVKEQPDVEKTIAAINAQDKDVLAVNIFNVLETVTVKEYPIINDIKKVMLENGAMSSLMSGSGPTVFALAEDKEAAGKIAKAVAIKTGAKVWVSKTRGSVKEDE